MIKNKVIIALNAAWNLYNFRAGLIRALVTGGHEILAVVPSWSEDIRFSQAVLSAMLTYLSDDIIGFPLYVTASKPENFSY